METLQAEGGYAFKFSARLTNPRQSGVMFRESMDRVE